MLSKIRTLLVILGVMLTIQLPTTSSWGADFINGHVVVLDGSSKIVPWTTYNEVVEQAWSYLLYRVPNDSQTGWPAYYSRSYLFPDTQLPADWPHNPAGLYGMLTESALKYYGYSGNMEVVNLAVNVATAQLNKGMTSSSSSWKWPNVPYASGNSGSLTYGGASYGNSEGRGDGTGVIEPDKLGEMGYAWLELYRFNGNTNFLNAAIASANALVSNVRDNLGDQKSPWPFRVYAESGVVREDYCANVIGPIRLFDGLISLGLDTVGSYQTTRKIAWDWLMAYPMQNNIWANYFEDVPIQRNPDNTQSTGNTNQYSAMMTARYLLEHPEVDPNWETHVRGLISWVELTFAEPAYGANTIAEQMVFHFPMGSHTSRYASVNALLSEKTGDAVAKEKAYRALNWATYMSRSNGVVTNSSGVVIDGPLVNTQWFTDGYGDYIRHFMTSFGAVPEWAPTGQNHLLRSNSIVKNISYSPLAIAYTTADSASTEVLRLDFTPSSVTVDGQALGKRLDLTEPGWTFEPELKVLRVRHDTGTNIQISLVVQPGPLTVTTASLPDATLNMSYPSPALAATGGTAPYIWSLAEGALPPGLSLSSTGIISGTPSAGGTSSFTVQVGDTGTPPNTATKTLSITVVTSANFSIWPPTVPVIADSGPDSAVELGVKFYSDLAGSITGIRFYKASANTGIHIGNLWSSTGALLATATFTGESGSGWQQANFSSPVAISANTVYVASYHTNAGHYSCDQYYFATTGIDHSPLHAPADGSSGPNGVYAYGTSSSFPRLGWRSSNYWVDVVLSTAVIPQADTTPPTAPTNLTAAAISPTQVDLNWTASTDIGVGVTSYQVMRDNVQIATSSSTSYSDTTVIPGAAYIYIVRAIDAAGNVSLDSNAASVTTPTVSPAPVLDLAATTKQSAASRTISSPRFSTANANELLVAFIASDGPKSGGSQRITTVTGGNLTWTLRARANAQAGTAEIWVARAMAKINNVAVTATRATGSYRGMITVVAFQGANLTVNGATANASAASGAPMVSFITTRANSVVWGVGDDWDKAVARAVSPGQAKLSEYLAPSGDTFWVQYITTPVTMAGVTATISCSSPTNDRWNLAAIEVLPQ